jgi:hypothetical protein
MTTRYTMAPVRRSHIGLIVLLLICLVAALGFYRGWFTVSEHREAISNKVDVNLKVDTDKMKNDVRHATDKTEQKASELSSKLKQEAKDIKGRISNK